MLGTFFTIEQADITGIIGHMSTLFDDLSPLLLLIIGVGIAMLVVGFIIRAFSR